MDEKRNYTLRKDYQKQVVDKAVEYMLYDLKEYFADKKTKKVSSESIEKYIQRCCNLYINYTVIDKVITMTGLKERILKQDEFSSLGDIIILAREFALYHNILELKSTTEGKESWKSLLNELNVLLSTGSINDNVLQHNQFFSETEAEQITEVLDYLLSKDDLSDTEGKYLPDTKFIEVLNGERQINLGISGANDIINDKLKLFYDEAIEIIDDDFIFDCGYSDAESHLAEINTKNGIGEYKYAYTRFIDDPKQVGVNTSIRKEVDLLSELVELVKNYLDTEAERKTSEADQETLDNIKVSIKKLLFPHSDGYGLHGLEFSPLGINHAVACYYSLTKVKRIKLKLKELSDKAKEVYNKAPQSVKDESSDYAEKPSIHILINELWSLCFNPVSKPGFRKVYDDRYADAKNLSWKQNAYSLENIIGSVLDAMGAYSNIYYSTDDFHHREPEFVGYYKGMFNNLAGIKERKVNKKLEEREKKREEKEREKAECKETEEIKEIEEVEASTETKVSAETTNDPKKTIVSNGKIDDGNPWDSKKYYFLFDGKNRHSTGFNDIDYLLDTDQYNLEFPQKLNIILPLCIDTKESELFNMIRSLSMCYPKVLDINDSEDQLTYKISLHNASAQINLVLKQYEANIAHTNDIIKSMSANYEKYKADSKSLPKIVKPAKALTDGHMQAFKTLKEIEEFVDKLKDDLIKGLSESYEEDFRKHLSDPTELKNYIKALQDKYKTEYITLGDIKKAIEEQNKLLKSYEREVEAIKKQVKKIDELKNLWENKKKKEEDQEEDKEKPKEEEDQEDQDQEEDKEKHKKEWVKEYSKVLSKLKKAIADPTVAKIAKAYSEYHDKIVFLSKQSISSEVDSAVVAIVKDFKDTEQKLKIIDADSVKISGDHNDVDALIKERTIKEFANVIDKQIQSETQAYYDQLDQIMKEISDPIKLFVCQTARYPGRLAILSANVEELWNNIVVMKSELGMSNDPDDSDDSDDSNNTDSSNTADNPVTESDNSSTSETDSEKSEEVSNSTLPKEGKRLIDKKPYIITYHPYYSSEENLTMAKKEVYVIRNALGIVDNDEGERKRKSKNKGKE